MSGAKRRTKYRKHVEAEVLEEYPEPKADEEVVQVVASRGGNMLEVINAKGEKMLCILPAKFRKLVWVRRGTFLIVRTADDDYQTSAGKKGKVTCTVSHVLLLQGQVRHLRNLGFLKGRFEKQSEEENQQVSLEKSELGSSEEDGVGNSENLCESAQLDDRSLVQDPLEADMDDVFVNRNRQEGLMYKEDEDSSESDED